MSFGDPYTEAGSVRKDADVVMGPVPLVVSAIGLLGKTWHNPVFRRLYARTKLKPIMGHAKIFKVGLVLSALLGILCIYVLGTSPEKNIFAFGAVFIYLVAIVMFMIPGALLMVATPLRILAGNMMGPALAVRKDIDTKLLSSVFSTPQSDSEIFFGLAFPNLIGGLGFIEDVAVFLVGLLLLPGITLWGYVLIGAPDEIGVYAWVTLAMICSFALGILMNVPMVLLQPLAAVNLALRLPTVAATVLTALSTVLITLLGISMLYFWLCWMYELEIPGSAFLIIYGLVAVLMLTALLTVVLTGIGILGVARMRRPG